MSNSTNNIPSFVKHNIKCVVYVIYWIPIVCLSLRYNGNTMCQLVQIIRHLEFDSSKERIIQISYRNPMYCVYTQNVTVHNLINYCFHELKV